jgi:5-carboxymethyl-2-hydroxymuconate isomerase
MIPAETQQQYFHMLDHLQNGRTEEARGIVSDILSQKLAAQLSAHNEAQLQTNNEKQETEISLVKSSEDETTGE